MSSAVQYGPGAPDRACDFVAASIAEEYLRRDSEASVDVRVSGGHGVLFIAAETHGSADFDVAAVVKRSLAEIDPALALEPFVALEAMRPPQRPTPVVVFGFATNETPSYLPPVVEQSRELVREIERLRLSDPDWYWLAPDYEAAVEGGKAFVRVSHGAGGTLESVREQVSAALASKFSGEIHVNVAGADNRGGLTNRVGSSGQPTQPYGSKLMFCPSGIGRELRHPENLGRHLARAAARRLVAAGLGKAVLVELLYHPLETKPSVIGSRNERGENLSRHLERESFDLASPPEGWTLPRLLTAELRCAYDPSQDLPWES